MLLFYLVWGFDELIKFLKVFLYLVLLFIDRGCKIIEVNLIVMFLFVF